MKLVELTTMILSVIALTVYSEGLFASVDQQPQSCKVDVAESNKNDKETPNLGYQVAGSKIYALLVKLPQLTLGQFSEHWRDPHGTLTKRLPYFKRYVQNHSLEVLGSVPGFTPIPFDGIPAVWVEQPEDLEKASNDPRYVDLDADVDKLYQRSKTVWIQGTEYIWCRSDGSAPTNVVKAMLFFKKSGNAQLSAGLNQFLTIVQSLMPTAVEVSVLIPDDQNQGPYDVVVEVVFTTNSAFESAWRWEGDQIVEAAELFANMNGSGAFLARGETVIADDGR
jgi:hypothetical protein